MDAPPVLDALEAFLEASDEDAAEPLRELLEQLIEAELWVADDGELAYFETKNRQIYLAVFTSPEEAKKFAPRHDPRPTSALEAVTKVARGDFSGLVLNPAGHCFELSEEDVRDFFDITP